MGKGHVSSNTVRPANKLTSLQPKPVVQADEQNEKLSVTHEDFSHSCSNSFVEPTKVLILKPKPSKLETLMSDLKSSQHQYEITPLLPEESFVVSSNAGTFIIRCAVSTVEDWEAWLEEFKFLSNTSWIVRRSITNQTTIELSKDYTCQHSSYRKTTSSAKNCSCSAFLKIRIKVELKQSDNYTKMGLRGIVTLNNNHNHTTNTAESLSCLKASSETRLRFNEYSNGLNASEAMKSHSEYLEMTSEERLESTLANASVNPKNSTIQYWYSMWRKLNLGSRSGAEMIEVLKKKMEIYEKVGTIIKFQSEPFAICIITPIMIRAHSLEEARQVVFLDSTSSCDSHSNTITFMLSPCAAGAVPLAVFITGGQSEDHYSAAFKLLKEALNSDVFAIKLSPKMFMTDDSDAETNALAMEWPNSALRLCIFHVIQSVWRWLLDSKNNIDKEDRRTLMNEFQSVVNAYSQDEATILYKEAITSSTANKYKNWVPYFDSYWNRKEKWCKAWRGLETLGHHTNNYSEAAVRIFKDLVLNRCKAYNAISLLEFTINVLEPYYVRRLRSFAHSRNPTLRLLLKKQLNKSAYIESKSQILVDRADSHVFLVPSSKDNSMYYEVNTRDGRCTCFSGKYGRFCKHEAAVYNYFGASMPRMPHINAAVKHKIAVLALGNKAEPLKFYASLKLNDECEQQEEPYCDLGSEVDLSVHKNSPHLSESSVTADSEDDTSSLINTIQDLHKKFGTNSKAMKKLVLKLQQIKSRAQWDTFMFSGFNPIRYKSGAAIRVQPTALSRRREGITRGSKRSAAGRPALGTSRSVKKRKRCLAFNIQNNQANAKSH